MAGTGESSNRSPLGDTHVRARCGLATTVCSRYSCTPVRPPRKAATSSISTRAPNGSPATATVVLAGYGFVNRRPYAPFIAGKSAMFVRYTLHLMTSSMESPASPSTSSRLSNARIVCASTSPSISFPVAGSTGVWPER